MKEKEKELGNAKALLETAEQRKRRLDAKFKITALESRYNEEGLEAERGAISPQCQLESALTSSKEWQGLCKRLDTVEEAISPSNHTPSIVQTPAQDPQNDQRVTIYSELVGMEMGMQAKLVLARMLE